MKKSTLALALATACTAPPVMAEPTVDEKLQILQQEIDDLKAKARATGPQTRQQPAPETSAGYGSTPSGAEALSSGTTSFGGYGELSYSRLRDSGNATADVGRFVFGINHRFDDRLTFQSEVEFEHAVTSADDEGETEIEQAWLNYRITDAANIKGGLFLIPLGILNETHEPPTYYGVFRNEVETRIIPTTWRELGFGVHGLTGEGLRYDAGITTNFDSGKLDDPAFGIRSAHQEGQLANAHDLAVYGALNYRRPGLLVGGGIFSGNTGQNGASNPALRGVPARFTIWDLHAQYRVERLELQALYASGALGDSDQLNAAVGAAAAAPFAVPKTMKGGYLQAAYHAYRRENLDIAPFVRIERFEIRQQEDPTLGLFQDPDNNERVNTFGINFRIHPQVVLKADIQRYSTDSSKNRFDIGIGYMF